MPDLILQMDSRTGFSKVLLGRPARHALEPLQIYAGMLAHGCSMDASDVSLMIPQLTANQVLGGMQFFENKDIVRAANDAVAGFQKRLPICSAWGDGSLASSDMLLTNLCLAWTAAQMQEHLYGDATVSPPPHDLEWLSHVSPAHFSNINFRGVFSFPVEKYREWLFSHRSAAAA